MEDTTSIVTVPSEGNYIHVGLELDGEFFMCFMFIAAAFLFGTTVLIKLLRNDF